jgi:hypothetical protein
LPPQVLTFRCGRASRYIYQEALPH